MKLGDYIIANQLTNHIFAEKLAPYMGKRKLSHRTVETWRQGRALPRGIALKAIGILTKDQVTYMDFVKNLRSR